MASGGLYNVLGAAPDVSQQELKSCYQRAVRQCHPDKLPQTCSDAERAAAMQRFCNVDTAWRTLGDDKSRKAYDARLAEQELRKLLPLNEEVRIDDMDWQEDGEVYAYGCRCGGEYVASDKDIAENIDIISCNTCTLSIQLVISDPSSDTRVGDDVQPT